MSRATSLFLGSLLIVFGILKKFSFSQIFLGGRDCPVFWKAMEVPLYNTFQKTGHFKKKK